MGRELTLRGSIDTEWQSVFAAEKLVFNYESPDRTRGWKVKGAWLWIDTKAGNTISSNNNPIVVGCLTTDSIDSTGFGVRMNALTSVDDNRTFGWVQVHYRGFDAQDYFVPHASTPASQGFLLDLDRIVTNEMYMYVNCLTNDGLTTPNPVTVNYLIHLEEIKISPSQSILQQLKGIGQDIDN